MWGCSTRVVETTGPRFFGLDDREVQIRKQYVREVRQELDVRQLFILRRIVCKANVNAISVLFAFVKNQNMRAEVASTEVRGFCNSAQVKHIQGD